MFRPPGAGVPGVPWLRLVPFLLIPIVLSGAASDGGEIPLPLMEGCRAEISYPIDIRIVPMGTPKPGGVLSARIAVSARQHLDGLQIRVEPSPEVQVLTSRHKTLGILGVGEERQEDITLLLPRGNDRRTVTVVAEAMIDGYRLSRSAVLNLVFEPEPFRLVTTPDGRRIREVPARRVGE